MISPANIVAQMLVCDDFSAWLGIKIQKVIQGEVEGTPLRPFVSLNYFKRIHQSINAVF